MAEPHVMDALRGKRSELSGIVSHLELRWSPFLGSPALRVDCDGTALVFVKGGVSSHKVVHEYSMSDPWLPDRTGDT